MSLAGLQIWSSSGVLLLDSSDRLGRIVGNARVAGTNASVSADLSQGTAFYSFQPDFLFAHTNQVTPPPIFTINAGGISWVYDTDGGTTNRNPVTGMVFFGVF